MGSRCPFIYHPEGKSAPWWCLHPWGETFSFCLYLVLGETDGSSYPNGGLRATHRAGGYLSVDPTSHIFLRGDTIFIPGKSLYLIIENFIYTCL